MTYINWNITNWITIVLMAALGMAVVTFGAKTIDSGFGSGGKNA